MRYLKLLLLLTMFYLACSSYNNGNIQFVNKYSGENFFEFRNTSFLVRSGNGAGGYIIFAYDDRINHGLDNGAYVITIASDREKVLNTDRHLMQDTTIADTKRLEALALKFMKYKIGVLSVDSTNNVFISLKMNSRPDLIRFSDIKYKNDKYGDWVKIINNWYENRESQ